MKSSRCGLFGWSSEGLEKQNKARRARMAPIKLGPTLEVLAFTWIIQHSFLEYTTSSHSTACTMSSKAARHLNGCFERAKLFKP